MKKKTNQIIKILEKTIDLIEKCGGPGGTMGPCPGGGRSEGVAAPPKVRLGSQMSAEEKEKHLKPVLGDLKQAGFSGRMVKKGDSRSIQISKGSGPTPIDRDVSRALVEKAGWKEDSSQGAYGGNSSATSLSKNGLSIEIASIMDKPPMISIKKMVQN